MKKRKKDKRKNKDERKKNHKNDVQQTIRFFIQSLNLNRIPDSSKVNLACTLVLLVALGIVLAEPILANIDRIAISFFNMLISIFSTRELLESRGVDDNSTAIWCMKAFIFEIIGCPTLVFILDGFKNMKK